MPLLVVLAVYVATDGLSQRTYLALAVVAAAAWIAFTLYWVFVRVRPLQRELESLQRATAR